MREQLEIIINNFKWQNNLDVHSELSQFEMTDLKIAIFKELDRINKIQEIKNIG
jgi:hypothetical protein